MMRSETLKRKFNRTSHVPCFQDCYFQLTSGSLISQSLINCMKNYVPCVHSENFDKARKSSYVNAKGIPTAAYPVREGSSMRGSPTLGTPPSDLARVPPHQIWPGGGTDSCQGVSPAEGYPTSGIPPIRPGWGSPLHRIWPGYPIRPGWGTPSLVRPGRGAPLSDLA